MKSLIVRCSVLLCAAVLLSACASGPKYAEVSAAIPAIPEDKGRIYFYRSGTMFGAGIQPAVMLNGEKVGDSQPGGFFFVDAAPGNNEVVLSTEVERKLTFTLDKKQTQYVKMTVGLGVIVYRVYPELSDAKEGEPALRELSYTGTAVKVSK